MEALSIPIGLKPNFVMILLIKTLASFLQQRPLSLLSYKPKGFIISLWFILIFTTSPESVLFVRCDHALEDGINLSNVAFKLEI